MADTEASRAARGGAWLAGDRLWIALASVILTLVVLPLIALAAFTQPAADDFCLTNRVVDEGIVGFNRSIYLAWTGRFFTTVLYALFYAASATSPRAWLAAYKLGATMTFAALVAALWMCVRAWSARTWPSPATAWGITAVTASLWVLGMPSLYEGLFWAASSLQYALSVAWVLGLVAAGAALSTTACSQRARAVHGVLAMLLSIAAIGSNETVAALVFAFLALMVAATWRERALRGWWLAIVAVALLATAALLAAPGNYQRLAHVAPLSLPHALVRTVRLLAENVASWLTPALAIGVVLVVLLSARAEATLVRAWPHPCVVVVGMLAVLAGMLAPSIWAYGGDSPPRVLSTIFLVFVTFAVVFGLHLSAYLRARYPGMFARVRAGAANVDVRIVLCGLALVSLLGVPNFRVLWRDLAQGHARAFAEASVQRYAAAASAPRGAALALAPIAELPTTLTQADLSSDPRDWKNACFAKHFGLLSVHVELPAPRGAR
ncbi:MAG: DUF6056 family protein [Polyangiales bacterium]